MHAARLLVPPLGNNHASPASRAFQSPYDTHRCIHLRASPTPLLPPQHIRCFLSVFLATRGGNAACTRYFSGLKTLGHCPAFVLRGCRISHAISPIRDGAAGRLHDANISWHKLNPNNLVAARRLHNTCTVYSCRVERGNTYHALVYFSSTRCAAGCRKPGSPWPHKPRLAQTIPARRGRAELEPLSHIPVRLILNGPRPGQWEAGVGRAGRFESVHSLPPFR